MSDWKRMTLADLPDDPARPRRGINSRSVRVDLNGLRIAIDHYTEYVSLEEYLKKRKPLDKQTIDTWLANEEGWLSKNSVVQIINDIRIPDPKLILVTCREQLHDEDTFVLRTAVHNVIQAINPQMHERDEHGNVCLVNVWEQFIRRASPQALAILRADESALVRAMDSWCRDGLLQQNEQEVKHYTFFFLSDDQLRDLAFTSAAVFRIYVEQASRRATQNPGLLDLLCRNLATHCEEARIQIERGLNFRRNRRLFYEAFGLDLAGVGQSIGCLLDPLDGKFMQVRFYMKVKHGFITPGYQSEMEEINDPSMVCLEKIAASVDPVNGVDVDGIVDAFSEDIELVETMIAIYDDLRARLIASGLISSDGLVLS